MTNKSRGAIRGRANRGRLFLSSFLLLATTFLSLGATPGRHPRAAAITAGAPGAGVIIRQSLPAGRIVGTDYGPFRKGQSPEAGVFPSAAQMREDMPVLRRMADCFRTYSVTNGFDQLPPMAQQEGMNIVPSAWLGRDLAANEAEIAKIISTANANDNVLFVSVGSEVLLRNDLTKAQLLNYVGRVRQAVSVPVTTAEPWHLWRDNSDLADAVDLIFINVHPYWEQQPVGGAADYALRRYDEIKAQYPGRRVIISETGWPSAGEVRGAAVPSPANQRKFILDFLAKSLERRADFFLFEATDEAWKSRPGGEVEGHWGFYNADRLPKHDLTSLNPIDDAQYFVRQHYRDFLNREADAQGLAFWTDQMTNCGNPNLEVCRINVSAAFFLSIEFQNTGYLVERVYKAAYGDTTDATTGLVVPIIRRPEFVTDAPLISQGVVVNAPGWEQVLESNKVSFARVFVQRQRFTDIYGSLSPTDFVNRLNQNAGGVLTDAERAGLISEAAANTAAARASVLRKVAENAELDRRERNRAFVLMQYYGYLGRDPNDAPERDLNYAGWNFWLTKLDRFGGDYIQAEMVKAFISSIEYRERFVHPSN